MEAAIHYLELVQSALHRHKYIYFQIIIVMLSRLYHVCRGNLKNQLHQATLKDDFTWSQFKIIADSIVLLLKTSQMQLYDDPPSGKSIPHFQPYALSSISPV